MQEFIEELKHNQKINFEKGLENRVNIDYVIERLEDIRENLLLFLYNFNKNNNLTKEQQESIEYIKNNLKSKGMFKNESN